jgi:hypothetical protein
VTEQLPCHDNKHVSISVRMGVDMNRQSHCSSRCLGQSKSESSSSLPACATNPPLCTERLTCSAGMYISSSESSSLLLAGAITALRNRRLSTASARKRHQICSISLHPCASEVALPSTWCSLAPLLVRMFVLHSLQQGEAIKPTPRAIPGFCRAQNFMCSECQSRRRLCKPLCKTRRLHPWQTPWLAKRKATGLHSLT